MDCPVQIPGEGRDFWRSLRVRSAERRIPFSGSIALTHRCNLRCVHCYLRSERSSPPREDELNTNRLLALLDEIADAGCLSLLLTGGEPLVRPDFGVIYEHAKRCGFLVTVFTNATLVTPDVVGLFCDLPPRAVEVSVYGASRDTYERITGVAGSYDRCMEGLRRLFDAGLPVRVKTVLMTLNRHEFAAIQEMAEARGVPFRMDAAIFPRCDGDPRPLQYRVSPDEAVEAEFISPERAARWAAYLDSIGSREPTDRLYDCGAGLNTFHVDPSGHLQPCLMEDRVRHHLGEVGFGKAWPLLGRIRAMKVPDGSPCGDCALRTVCGYCPPFCALEQGQEGVPNPYMCLLGARRSEMLSGCTAREVSVI